MHTKRLPIVVVEVRLGIGLDARGKDHGNPTWVVETPILYDIKMSMRSSNRKRTVYSGKRVADNFPYTFGT